MAYWLTIERERGDIAALPAVMGTASEGKVYGTTVPQILDRLDRIAQELGAVGIDRFIYKDPSGYARILKEAEAEHNAVLASAMRAEIDIISERPRWHEPSSARATVRSLREFLTTNQQALPGKDPAATTRWTLWDLEAYDRILADLEAQGRKFAFVERQGRG
jgi:hypothetical protein